MYIHHILRTFNKSPAAKMQLVEHFAKVSILL